MRKIFYWMVLITIPVLVLVLIGELYGAVYVAGKRLYRFDAEFGWVPKSNFTYNRLRSDSVGNTYNVTLTTNEYGFRQWGDLNSEKPRILFIGDSVTGDPNMSDQDAYFGRVNELVDAEVFAIGGGGYGTLQELMVLRKYVNTIDPDFSSCSFAPMISRITAFIWNLPVSSGTRRICARTWMETRSCIDFHHGTGTSFYTRIRTSSGSWTGSYRFTNTICTKAIYPRGRKTRQEYVKRQSALSA
jgi:hypothetical protein